MIPRCMLYGPLAITRLPIYNNQYSILRIYVGRSSPYHWNLNLKNIKARPVKKGKREDGFWEEQRSLLEEGLIDQKAGSGLFTRDGSVDLSGKPVHKQNSGNWKACPFILGTECCERLADIGISTNLLPCLTSKLHEGNVSAARNFSTWAGTCYLTALIEPS